MVSTTQLAWKLDFLSRLISTTTNIIAGFICVSLPILILFLTPSFLFPIGILISFGVIILDDINQRGLGSRRVRHVTWLLEAVCKDNCYNWLNKFIAFVSIDPTIPSTWGPSFDLAISTLDPGAFGKYFCRIPD